MGNINFTLDSEYRRRMNAGFQSEVNDIIIICKTSGLWHIANIESISLTRNGVYQFKLVDIVTGKRTNRYGFRHRFFWKATPDEIVKYKVSVK